MNDSQTDIDLHFMSLALVDAAEAAAAGDVGVAALVVRGSAIVGRGRNRAVSRNDPLAHAETEAIVDAHRRVGADALAECTLYTTVEPCPMCAGAIHLARLRRIVLGARHASLGRTDLGGYAVESFAELLSQKVELTTGVLTDACRAIRVRTT